MICEDCKGTKRKLVREKDMDKIIPCPTCNGEGIAYCCEGSELPCDVERKDD